MSSAKKAFDVLRVGVRHMSTKKKQDKIPAGFCKIKNKQEKFQVDDGLPIHLKGGVVDKVLYQTTMAMCVLGLGMTTHFLVTMMLP